MQKCKPLHIKAYGSIPHFEGSRVGPADHHCFEGQYKICCIEKRQMDKIYVTEKLDGSCTSVAKVNDHIVSLGRAGWEAETSPYEQHQLFAKWIKDREEFFYDILDEGERLVGEWMVQAHGTIYMGLESPWYIFDWFDVYNKRYPYKKLVDMCKDKNLHSPKLLNYDDVMSINSALCVLGDEGFYKAVDKPEGAVWRVESNGEFNYMAKYVRPNKIDGCYLPEISGSDIIYNYRKELI